MKVSLITVCYNSSTTLKDTIESVKRQTYSDIEYIIVDGKSKDKTLDIVNSYHPGVVTKFISESDKGLYDAMNKGIKMATGDIIALINSDDLFCDDEALEKIVREFKNSPEADAVYADLYYVSQNNTDNIVRHWITGNQKKFKKGWHPAHPTLYLKKHVYDKFGYFDLEYSLAADFEIMLRFIDKYKINLKYFKEPLVKMRLGGETNKSIKNILNQNVECIKAFKNNDLSVNSILYPFYRILPKVVQFFKK